MDKEKINNSVNEYLKKPNVKLAIYVIGALAIALVVFKSGELVGARKENFAYRWGENYHQNFGGPREGFMMMMYDHGAPNPHGTFGKIVSINLPNIIISDQKNAESTVVITDDTDIHQFRDDIEKESLKVGDNVVVLGRPNESGQIEATLIRVMPATVVNATSTNR